MRHIIWIKMGKKYIDKAETMRREEETIPHSV